jgi:hypothetical protein
MKTILIIVSLFVILAGIAWMISIYFIGRGMQWGQLDKPPAATEEQYDDPLGR